AMQAGADMAATSVHKLGGSMAQSSILNIQGTLVSTKRIQAILSMLTTTSTSYILLASLDTARKSLATEGQALLEDTIRMAEKTRNQINRIEHLYCAGSEILGTSATFAIDPTKLVISVKELGVTGYAVEKWLREKFNIEVELSDLYNILCIITPGDKEEDVLRLVHALKELSREFKHQSDTDINTDVLLPEIPLLALTPRDAFYAETEVVPFEESIGRIIAEFVMVYPPGIPIFIPGEIITEENVLYTKKNIEAGLPVQGAEDLNLKFIHVLKEHRALK
ncbi:arginine decarboxylase, partial [Priestia megaterium]|nr:arginine decarboxylase [Priestia megaterium]